jgi:hypothetical protein
VAADNKTRTVETEFKVRDSFSGGMSKMGGAFGRASGKLNELQNKFRDFRREQGLTTLGALGLGYGIGSWIEKIKEANSEFGRTQKGIAGVLSSSLKFERGAGEIDRYNRSMRLSKDITESLEDTSARFATSFDDVANSYRTVVAAAGPLGLSQKQVLTLTEQSTATAKRFGVDGVTAATSIARALQTGTVRGFDPFNIGLRNALGNMKKLTEAQRFSHIQRALQGSMQVADAMSTGIGASLQRAQTTVTALLRDATGPLFKEIAGSLDKWSKHLRDMGANGKPLVEAFAGKLVTAFHELERVSKFIKDHWLAIAGVKVGVSLGANAGRIAEMFGKMGGGGGGEAGVGGVTRGLGAMAQQLGLVVGGLSAFKMGLDLVLGHLEKRADEDQLSREGGLQAIASADMLKHITAKSDELGLSAVQTRYAQKEIDRLHHAGVVTGEGKLDKSALAYHLGNMSSQERYDAGRRYGISDTSGSVGMKKLADALANDIEPLLNQLGKPGTVLAQKAKDDKNLMFAKGNTVINGNLNIQMRWEDEDPDRGFIRFQRKIEAGIRGRGGQAMGAEPEAL